MTVVIAVSRREGQVIFCASARTSCMNLNRFVLAMACPVGSSGEPAKTSRELPSPAWMFLQLLRIAPPRSDIPRPAPDVSRLAGVEGLEPPTPGFGDRCSSQLSYTPIGDDNDRLTRSPSSSPLPLPSCPLIPCRCVIR